MIHKSTSNGSLKDLNLTLDSRHASREQGSLVNCTDFLNTCFFTLIIIKCIIYEPKPNSIILL